MEKMHLVQIRTPFLGQNLETALFVCFALYLFMGASGQKSHFYGVGVYVPLGEKIRGGALRTPYFGQKMEFWLKDSLDLWHVGERGSLSRQFYSSCHLVVGAEG